MELQDSSVVRERLLASRDEAGTAPDDRRFRPDVEGLRAVAVLLVVLYHADVPRLTGGYVGVDAFFVISGFVITGLLLRERAGTGHTSILDFYARRCRRILPAATLVILVVVLFTYTLLGFVAGNSVADDGRWVAAFLANFHFEASGTNYLSSSLPPSPLQNFWSLSVEEQFYIAYPTLFLLAASAKGSLSLRARMTLALLLVSIASYTMSILQTSSHPALAYFSPFTRAWELALGALVAVNTTWLKNISGQIAAILTWVGLGAILYSALAFNAQTAYPGSLAAVPVLGTALVIAGGVAVPRAGAESLLRLLPFRWLGKLSYSLYLWHWPILTIAAERAGKIRLPVGMNLLLVLLALAFSVVSFHLIENPVRHLRVPSKLTVGAGLALVGGTIGILSLAISSEIVPIENHRVIPAANRAVVLNQVAAAPRITSVPKSIDPPLSDASKDFVGFGNFHYQCAGSAGVAAYKEPICTLGDPHGAKLMVVYGDSHALMWLPALDNIAKTAGWRLIILTKYFCPAEMVTVANPQGFGPVGGSYSACTRWHLWAVRTINRLHPSLVLVTQESLYPIPGSSLSSPRLFSTDEWREGLVKLFNAISIGRAKRILLGNIPVLPQSGPICLAAHTRDVQACSASAESSTVGFNQTEASAASSIGVDYINPIPWFCSATCTAIVGRYDVYEDQFHMTATYGLYLQNVLARTLGLSSD